MRLSTLLAFAAGIAVAIYLCHLDETARRRAEFTQASVNHCEKTDRLVLKQ